VDVAFEGVVLKRGPTRLSFRAGWRRWDARWEIDWCFHKCGEASDKIRRTIHVNRWTNISSATQASSTSRAPQRIALDGLTRSAY